MKTHLIFPTEFVEFVSPDVTLHQTALSLLSQEPFIDNGGFHTFANKQTKSSLHKDPKYAELTQFVKNCLEEYRKEFKYDCESFDITQMWANQDKASSGTQQPKHKHYLAFISGVFYLTPGSPTAFFDSVEARKYNPLKVNRIGEAPVRLYEAQPGKLIIFPSWVEHATEPHKMPWDRWTVAFNAMPAGKINAETSGSKTPAAILRVE